MQHLLQRWNGLMGRLRVPENMNKSWFNIVTNHYQENWRFYHNLNHIQELYMFYDQYQTKLNNKECIELAIWFHDVIYTPSQNNNEEMSAELYRTFCDEARPPTDLHQPVHDYILSTKAHKVTSDCADRDLKYFLDFDLAVLGKDLQDYMLYAEQIRQEYLPVYPEPKYTQGRIKVLGKLKEGGLFLTPEFQQLYENKAIQNITHEMNLLQSQL
uniref:HD domain-containing protein n=1 Tax=Arcella intermedia TaxID=1963864 RepID=A0A6B2LIX7_9EUKA